MGAPYSIIDRGNQNRTGMTELHLAAYENDVIKIEALLARGENVNVKDNLNTIPLHDAANYDLDGSHSKAIEILLKNGADINAVDDNGRTPIHYLVTGSNLASVKLFLNSGAKTDVVDEYGLTLLFPAAGYNTNVDVVQLLIDLGFDTNHRDFKKVTPLHWACDNEKLDNIKVIKCLAKNGANVNAVSDQKTTPLIVALRNINSSDMDEEILEKKLKFIVEHSDFNMIHNSKILDCADEPLQDYAKEIIYEHVAKLQTLNIPVSRALVNNMMKDPDYEDYFEECKNELLHAKNFKIENSWVTFYNILIDGRKKLKNYAGNMELMKNLRKYDCVKMFPIYGPKMEKNLKKGIQRRKLFDKSANLLSNCLLIFGPSHLIIRDILNCMISSKDLSKFCEKI